MGPVFKELLSDLKAGFCFFVALNSQTHQICPGVDAFLHLSVSHHSQQFPISFLPYLEDRCIHVFRIGRCHRLQRNSVLAPNRNLANLHAQTYIPFLPSWRRFT